MNKHEITFKNGNTGSTIIIQFDKDSNINDWKDIIKTIMVSATFGGSTLDFLDINE